MEELKSFQCEVIITSDTFGPDDISVIIKCNPSRSYKKGDKFVLKSSGSIAIRQQNLWAFSTKESYDDQTTITDLINEIIDVFGNDLDGLVRLKNNPECEVILWVWIQGYQDGLGLEIPGSTLRLINDCFNRLNMSFVN